MKKEVILLGLDQERAEEFQQKFSNSFNFTVIQQFFDLQDLSKYKNFDAVVIDALNIQDALLYMRKNYPFLPCMILDKGMSKKHNRLHQRQVMNSLGLDELEKNLNVIIERGRRFQKKTVASESVKIMDKWNQLKATGLDEFMKSSMSLLTKYLKSENIVWVESDKVNYYLHQMWKVQTMNGHLRSRGRGKEIRAVHSHKGMTPKDVSTVLQNITEAAEEDWTQVKESKMYGSSLVIPALMNDVNYGYFVCMGVQNFSTFKTAKVLNHLSSYIAMRYEAAFEYSRVRELSYLDDLTELYNQRFLSKALDKCIENYENSGENFSVLFMDIDHFKKVNDNKGHIVGSKILVELGKILKQNIRSLDFGFRYGGDEYLLLLSDTDAETAQTVAERIRSQVENTVFELDGVKVQITLSIGIACFPLHAKNKQDVLEMADKAMYYGKNKSRNIVYMAS